MIKTVCLLHFPFEKPQEHFVLCRMISTTLCRGNLVQARVYSSYQFMRSPRNMSLPKLGRSRRGNYSVAVRLNYKYQLQFYQTFSLMFSHFLELSQRFEHVFSFVLKLSQCAIQLSKTLSFVI